MIFVENEDRVEIREKTETIMLETAIAVSDEDTAKEGIALIGRIAMEMARSEEEGRV